MSQALHEQYGGIERRENPTKDTEDRQKMADVIEEMWPAQLNDMADEAGYSRQHCKNVLDSHFRLIERDDEPQTESEDTNGLTIQVPDNVDKSSYLRGLVDGMEKAH